MLTHNILMTVFACAAQALDIGGKISFKSVRTVTTSGDAASTTPADGETTAAPHEHPTDAPTRFSVDASSSIESSTVTGQGEDIDESVHAAQSIVHRMQEFVDNINLHYDAINMLSIEATSAAAHVQFLAACADLAQRGIEQVIAITAAQNATDGMLATVRDEITRVTTGDVTPRAASNPKPASVETTDTSSQSATTSTVEMEPQVQASGGSQEVAIALIQSVSDDESSSRGCGARASKAGKDLKRFAGKSARVAGSVAKQAGRQGKAAAVAAGHKQAGRVKDAASRQVSKSVSSATTNIHKKTSIKFNLNINKKSDTSSGSSNHNTVNHHYHQAPSHAGGCLTCQQNAAMYGYGYR